MANYSRKDTDFHVERQEDLLSDRTYGFMKTIRSDTPIPLAKKNLSPTSLIERLTSMHGNITTNSESDDLSIEEQTPSVSTASNEMTFEMKRKLFDEAEFTITRGQKLSDLVHPGESEVKISFNDPAKQTLKEIEAYCQRMNIKFAK
uniref:Uncharacterized protein LOC108044605 n=1 Tax=Drosophila rhopaloa TaxID=1041015 RepID=A0A6P4F1H1_DRORH